MNGNRLTGEANDLVAASLAHADLQHAVNALIAARDAISKLRSRKEPILAANALTIAGNLVTNAVILRDAMEVALIVQARKLDR